MIDKKWLATGTAAAVLSVVIVAFFFVLCVITDSGEEADSHETASGWEFYSRTEDGQTDADSDEETAGTSAQEDAQARRAEIEGLEGSELWAKFDDAVLTGDSRVAGFPLYTGIPSGRVFARNGATIMALPGFIDGIAALDPERVYIAYGINDIKSGVGGGTAAAYALYAQERIRELEDSLDGAEIYVNSILPASASLQARDPDYRKVYDYNIQLREMCARCGWHYIDNSELAEEHEDLYVSDGIHLTMGFYEYWARNMLIQSPGVR